MQTQIFVGTIFALSTALIFFYKKINEKNKFCVGIDINKTQKNQISESTGIILLIPFWVTILFAFTTNIVDARILAFGILATTFALVGFFDDLKNKFLAKPMGWTIRALPIAIASLTFAFFFSPNIFWIIPLSLFIAGIASLQNTFAGLNGWEVGSGFIISIFVALALIGTQFFLISTSISAMIFALLLFNFFPAKIFPGDSGTLFIGSALSGLVVLTQNISLTLMTFLFFLPHLIDFFVLKLLTNRSDPTQQKIRPYKLLANQTLAIPDYPDKKTRYDFAKLVIKMIGPKHERTIVLAIWAIVTINCLFWFVVLAGH